MIVLLKISKKDYILLDPIDFVIDKFHYTIMNSYVW